jgi:hypothetical protein
MRVGSLSDTLSLPYAFQREDAFALGVGALVIGLLVFRFGLARRRAGRGS